tara:strand:- start:384 stop:851 length:468 start_codon:yes stop_codon:yes gene_type:complete
MAIVVFDVSGTLHEDRLGAPMHSDFFELFDKLKKHQIQIALATNLSRSGLDHFIDNNNLNPYLDEHISMSEAAPKPNPEMLQEILLRTGEIPENAIMVGDATTDIIMAQTLNVKVCAVSWDMPFTNSVLSLNPDYKVEKIAELWQVFCQAFHIKI